MTYTGEGIRLIGGQHWPEDVRPLLEHEIDDLADAGWVRILSRQGKARSYAVTGAGRAAWGRWTAQHAQGGEGVDLDWPGAKALLEQLHQRDRAAGSTDLGVPINDLAGDLTAEALVRALIRDEYLEEGVASDDVTTFVRTGTPKTLRLLEGWPAGPAQESLDDLVRALDAAISETPDEGRRSALRAVRDGVIGAARDVLLEYFEKKILRL